MIVADLPSLELGRLLAGPGIRLRTGPVVTGIRSRLSEVVDGLALHYANHPVESDTDFADFHVSLSLPGNLRRWLRPQVLFELDGKPPFLPLPRDQAFPLLEWGLNWCVSNHCHQYLIVHAAVVARSGRAALLPGPSGSGKSTLCAALINRGWALLSDELTLIELGTGNVVALPRPVSLKNASIEVIRAAFPQAVLGPVVYDTTKGSVAHMKPPAESVHRALKPVRPRWIILPRYEAGAASQLSRLPKARAFMQLADNAFNYSLHGRKGFEALAQTIDACDCHEFTYSALDDAMAVFDDLVRNA